MNTLFAKTATALVLVFLLGVGAWYSTMKGGAYREIRLPDTSISTIPIKLGNWAGEDIDVDEKLFRAVAAHEIVSRSYTNLTSGRALTLHGAVFDEFWRTVPHSPLRCYRDSGWTTLDSEDFELNAADGTQAIARLAHFEKNNVKTFVLFWFQFGDDVICNTPQLNDVRSKYRNDDTWPPTIKMMIQTSADKPDQAKKQLKEYADALYEVTRTFK